MVTAAQPERGAVIHSLHIEKSMEVQAPLAVTWKAVLDEMGPAGEMPGGVPFPMVLEAWPGGRWYRDLGDNAGHLWGHVQVIKPPKLLEITGPLFMSYPAISHVQYRLTEFGGGTRVDLVHRAIGEIQQDHLEGVSEGWEYSLARVRQLAGQR